MSSADVTQLDWCESALLMTSLARNNLKEHLTDLRAQLADVRLRRAEEALRGVVNMEEFEKKIFGKPKKRRRK